MKRKPWPIIILGFLHIVAPFTSLLFNAIAIGLPLHLFFVWVKTWSTLELIMTFGALPLAGIAILAVKEWSYPVFLVAYGWTIGHSLYTWIDTPQTNTVPFLLLILFSNLMAVRYFLLKEVRAPYQDPRLRWWESKPRYKLSVPMSLSPNKSVGLVQQGVITDISAGGCFITLSKSPPMHEPVRIAFEWSGAKYNFNAIVRHHRQFTHTANQWGVGIQFYELSKNDNKILQKFISSLKRAGHLESRAISSASEDFSQWIIRLFTTGKGWIPEAPIIHKPEENSIKTQEHAEKKAS